jgi:hypothetical protein
MRSTFRFYLVCKVDVAQIIYAIAALIAALHT